MGKTYLTDINLNKNSLNNARIQNLGSDPSTPVVGQTYFNTGTNKLRTYNGTTWDEYGTSTASGDVTGPVASIDSELALFSSTTGKVIKRASMTGLVKATSGVASAATSGTDYSAGTSALATGILKSTTTTGALTIAVAGDFPTLNQNTTGSAASLSANIAESQVTNLVTDLAAKAPLASPTFTGTVTVPTPSAGTDATNKTYVDGLVQGVKWKQEVRAATTAAGTLASSFANASVIDGVTLATGDRILIKDQAAGAENGIYTVNASGAPTRATDADTAAELKQATTFVQEGTVNADSQWVVTNDGAITLNTTALVWALAGNNSMVSASTTVQGKVELATQAEAQAKTDTVRALTPASVADFTRKYTGTIGDGTTTALAVTHGLGSQYVHAQCFDATSNALVECDVTLTSSTVTTFTFNTAPTTNQYRVVIVG